MVEKMTEFSAAEKEQRGAWFTDDDTHAHARRLVHVLSSCHPATAAGRSGVCEPCIPAARRGAEGPVIRRSLSTER